MLAGRATTGKQVGARADEKTKEKGSALETTACNNLHCQDLHAARGERGREREERRQQALQPVRQQCRGLPLQTKGELWERQGLGNCWVKQRLTTKGVLRCGGFLPYGKQNLTLLLGNPATTALGRQDLHFPGTSRRHNCALLLRSFDTTAFA